MEMTENVRAPENRPPHYASFVPEIKGIDAAKRQVTHLITNDSWDRAGDLIEEDGWDFENYRRNGVVLADHRYSIFSVIGRNVGLDKGKDGIYATTQFDQQSVGAEAFRLVQAELVKAWSVGFRGIKSESIMTGAKAKCPVCSKRMKAERMRLGIDEAEPLWLWGMHFQEQECMEYSLVAIPMNPDIVNNAVRDGLVAKGHVPLFFSSEHDEHKEAPPPAPATPPTAEEVVASPGSIARVRRVNPAREILAAVQDAQFNVRTVTQHSQIAEAIRSATPRRR